MGAPIVIAANGRGTPVRFVDKGGFPVSIAENGLGAPVVESVRGVPVTLDKGVPEYLRINGVLARLLKGSDGQPLTGADGQYLYGVA